MAESTAFSGAALTAIDLKGRLAIPATFRNPLIATSKNERWVVFQPMIEDECIQCFGTDRMDSLFEAVKRREALAIENGEMFDSRKTGGPTFTGLKPISFDASGRLILPPILRAAAGIEDLVFFAGNAVDFTMWNPYKLLERTEPQYKEAQFYARWHLDEMEGKGK